MLTPKLITELWLLKPYVQAKCLPKFKKPGTRNGKPVETPYSLLMTIYF